MSVREKVEAKVGRLFEINFITIHYAYFIFTGLFSAIVFWGSSTPSRSVSFTDSLFLCVSAMTEAGLNTVNLSTLNTWQQVILLFLILGGSAIFVSAFVILVRLRRFEKVFHEVISKRREERRKHGRRVFRRARPLEQVLQEERQAEEKKVETLPDDKKDAESDSPRRLSVLNEDIVEDSDHDRASLTSVEASKLRVDTQQEKQQRGRNITFEDNHLSPRPRFSTNPSEPEPFPEMHRSDTHQSRGSTSHVSRMSVTSPEKMPHRPLFSFTGVGATANSLRRHRATTVGANIRPLARQTTISSMASNQKPMHPWFPSSTGYFGRNSQVYGLSLEERQELGGYEYSAILFLAFLVPGYFFIWQILGALALGAWVNNNRPGTARENGIVPWWVGSFNAISAFNNSGMSLLDANMTAFSNSAFMLISMGLFIIAGNTGYPIFLRVAIWSIYKILKMFPNQAFWEFDIKTLRFLLDHPRRCYTNLFPAPHTWWLGVTLVGLNGIDWAAFEILNIGNNRITAASSVGYRVLDGLFQAFAVRSGGFYVVTITQTRISLQFLYVVMMYISAYPVAITMRNSNVYEESSLGIFSEDGQSQPCPSNTGLSPIDPKSGRKSLGGLKRTLTELPNMARDKANAPHREERTAFVRQQVRAQLSHDAWWMALAIFVILIIEGARFESNPEVFSAFNVIFEVVSAYGCVGISTGVPWAAYSFSGGLHTLSKLVMVAVMLRGRHRGLPVAIDQAVQLPGMKKIEEEVFGGQIGPSAGAAGVASGNDERALGLDGMIGVPTLRKAGTFTMVRGGG